MTGKRKYNYAISGVESAQYTPEHIGKFTPEQKLCWGVIMQCLKDTLVADPVQAALAEAWIFANRRAEGECITYLDCCDALNIDRRGIRNLWLLDESERIEKIKYWSRTLSTVLPDVTVYQSVDMHARRRHVNKVH